MANHWRYVYMLVSTLAIFLAGCAQADPYSMIAAGNAALAATGAAQDAVLVQATGTAYSIDAQIRLLAAQAQATKEAYAFQSTAQAQSDMRNAGATATAYAAPVVATVQGISLQATAQAASVSTWRQYGEVANAFISPFIPIIFGIIVIILLVNFSLILMNAYWNKRKLVQIGNDVFDVSTKRPMMILPPPIEYVEEEQEERHIPINTPETRRAEEAQRRYQEMQKFVAWIVTQTGDNPELMQKNRLPRYDEKEYFADSWTDKVEELEREGIVKREPNKGTFFQDGWNVIRLARKYG